MFPNFIDIAGEQRFVDVNRLKVSLWCVQVSPSTYNAGTLARIFIRQNPTPNVVDIVFFTNFALVGMRCRDPSYEKEMKVLFKKHFWWMIFLKQAKYNQLCKRKPSFGRVRVDLCWSVNANYSIIQCCKIWNHAKTRN